MRRIGLFALTFASLVSIPMAATAAQVVLADTMVTHTEATGATLNIGAATAPADFTSPENYAAGMVHHRVIVTTAPTNPMTYRVCLVQGAQSACSAAGITITGVGTFEATQAIATFTNYANITWTMPIDNIRVVAMDNAGVPVDASETTWVGSPDFALYYPLALTYQAVVVASGDAFEGYPGMMQGNPAEAPSLAPNGGTFEGSVAVTLASRTTDAMIYYTTDGTDPDDTSTLFDGTPIDITATTTVRAVTYATGFDPSPISSAEFTIVAELANGLRGRYFDTDDFRGLAMTRTDPVIDFVFPDGNPPAEGIGGTYSILWTGQVTPRYTDTYTITTLNDDGVRLWINDQLVIDDWNYHGPEERSGTIALTAGQPATVWLEYFNGGGEGTIRLSWESPQQPEEVIPAEQMVPNLPATTRPIFTLLPPAEESYPESHSEAITFEIRRRGNLDVAVTPAIAFSGTATHGEDTTPSAPNQPFEAGQMSRNVEIFLVNDTLVEGDETLILTLVDGGTLYDIAAPTTQQIVIVDDDVEVDSISGTITYTGTESGRIIVEAFRETDPVFAKRRLSLLNPGPYTIENLEEGDYTVIAYIDSDDDEQLDEDEIWGIYQGADLQPAFVTIPPGQTGIDINLDVAPGTVGGEDDDKGCCATISNDGGRTSGWLAMAIAVVVVGLRRRR